MLGNLLPAIEERLGADIDADSLEAIYHEGRLNSFLSDGHLWLARCGTGGEPNLHSLEPVPVSDFESGRIALAKPKEGSLVLVLGGDDDACDWSDVRIHRFAHCDVGEQFERKGSKQ